MRNSKRTKNNHVIDKMCEDFSSFINSIITGIVELSKDELSFEIQKEKQTHHTVHEIKSEIDVTRRYSFIRDMPENSFLRLPQVLSLIPVGKSTWWAGCKSGRFPKPTHLGPRTVVWRAGDIRAFLDQHAQKEATRK